jgi:hypothetical protein
MTEGLEDCQADSGVAKGKRHIHNPSFFEIIVYPSNRQGVFMQETCRRGKDVGHSADFVYISLCCFDSAHARNRSLGGKITSWRPEKFMETSPSQQDTLRLDDA